MLIKINRSYMMFLVYLYFFVFEQLLERYVFFVKYADECIALTAVPCYLIHAAAKKGRGGGREKWWPFIWLFLLVGLTGNLVYQYQDLWKAALPDMLLCVKFWLAIYTGECLFCNLDLARFARRIYFHIRLLVWLFAALIVLDQTLHIFTATMRYGLRSVQLFYDHPTYFAACCCLLISILLSIRPYLKRCDRYFFLLLAMMCTTLRSKAFGAACVFLLIYYIVLCRKKRMKLRMLLLVVPIILILAWDQIEYYFFSSLQSDSARYQLMEKAVFAACDHAPLGTGFGTFASHFSGVFYSPLYYIYRISNVNGLRKGASYFISDSFWPMILGQTGWLGLILISCALLCLFLCIQDMRKRNPACNAAGLCILAYLMISSIAESAFVNMLAVPLAIWLGVLLQKSRREEQSEKGGG